MTKRPRYNERPDHQRIVITGMGAITPLGLDVDSTWQRLIQGESGIKPITHFEASEYRAQIAGTVEGFDISQYMSAKDARRYDTFVQYGVAAAAQALQQAGFISDLQASPVTGVDPNRIGVLIGSGIGGITTIEENTLKLNQDSRVRFHRFLCLLPLSIWQQVRWRFAMVSKGLILPPPQPAPQLPMPLVCRHG